MTLPLGDETEPTTTAIEAVFEKLLGNIVSGIYAAGTRLPAERELARQLGASRPTLREALRRLGEWNLVEPRRGSGIVIRPYRDWTIGVMGAYMRYGKPTPTESTIPQLLLDMFELRRSILVDVVRLSAHRVPKGGTAGARIAMARAWAMRDQPSYVREDFEVHRCIVEAAKLAPGLWMLNTVASIYFDLISSLQFAITPPADYVPMHTRYFDLLEAGEAAEAVRVFEGYIERNDQGLTRFVPQAP